MDPNKSILFWEVCDELAKSSPNWKRGENLTSPVIRRDEDTTWSLRFYPSGVEEGTDKDDGHLVFSLERDNSESAAVVRVTLQLCHFTNPVRSYSMECRFEEGDISYKCQLADVENIAKLGIFVPLQTLCVRVFLDFCDL